MIFFREAMNLPIFEKTAFHSMHIKASTSENSISEEFSYEESNSDTEIDCPLSPGIRHITEDYRLSKSKKFNKAFDVSKTQAEVLSKMNQRTFDTHIKASKKFLGLLYNDLPQEILDYLNDPEQYTLIKRTDVEQLKNEAKK